jgi:hypothetical protein
VNHIWVIAQDVGDLYSYVHFRTLEEDESKYQAMRSMLEQVSKEGISFADGTRIVYFPPHRIVRVECNEIAPGDPWPEPKTVDVQMNSRVK